MYITKIDLGPWNRPAMVHRPVMLSEDAIWSEEVRGMKRYNIRYDDIRFGFHMEAGSYHSCRHNNAIFYFSESLNHSDNVYYEFSENIRQQR